MTAAATTAGSEQAIASLLLLERQTRAAADADALAWSMVNDAQALFGFRHAALLIEGRVRALTALSVLDPHAPFVAFVERALRRLQADGRLTGPLPVDPAWLDDDLRAEWQNLSVPHVLWLPLTDRQQQAFGGLWLARERPWTQGELALLGQLADCQAHAWLALQPRRRWRPRWSRRKSWLALAVAAGVLALPVRQSVLAPAEVVPLDGRVVAAPLDGVISEFLVKPNQQVEAGDLLLRFDATSLRAQADVAARALGVAEAELKASSQRAFADAESSARLDLLAARVEQKRAELAYARQLLARSEVRAEQAGIAVFADASRWTGRPVQTGEQLLEIADPARAELKIELPVADAIGLQNGSEVALFLDSDPLARHLAVLQRQAYAAETSSSGQLAYRLDASFAAAPPRIGLRGTARLYGERVPLLLFVLRRPVAALRQTLGL